MRFFALFTLLTLQFCMIHSREVKAQNVEDQLIEMNEAELDDSDLEEDCVESELEEDLDDTDMGEDSELEEDFADSDLEDDLEDSAIEENFDDYNAVELRARPPKRPFCVRTRHHPGWGGQCLSPANLKNQSCDFIWGGDDIVKVKKKYEEICRTEELYCCVNCYAKKQRDNCPADIGNLRDVLRECCDGNHNLHTLDSGCKCCGSCKRTPYCRKYNGWCVYKNGVATDPQHNGRPNNYDTCLEAGNTIRYKWCGGKNCGCCIPPST